MQPRKLGPRPGARRAPQNHRKLKSLQKESSSIADSSISSSAVPFADTTEVDVSPSAGSQFRLPAFPPAGKMLVSPPSNSVEALSESTTDEDAASVSILNPSSALRQNEVSNEDTGVTDSPVESEEDLDSSSSIEVDFEDCGIVGENHAASQILASRKNIAPRHTRQTSIDESEFDSEFDLDDLVNGLALDDTIPALPTLDEFDADDESDAGSEDEPPVSNGVGDDDEESLLHHIDSENIAGVNGLTQFEMLKGDEYTSKVLDLDELISDVVDDSEFSVSLSESVDAPPSSTPPSRSPPTVPPPSIPSSRPPAHSPPKPPTSTSLNSGAVQGRNEPADLPSFSSSPPRRAPPVPIGGSPSRPPASPPPKTPPSPDQKLDILPSFPPDRQNVTSFSRPTPPSAPPPASIVATRGRPAPPGRRPSNRPLPPSVQFFPGILPSISDSDLYLDDRATFPITD